MQNAGYFEEVKAYEILQARHTLIFPIQSNPIRSTPYAILLYIPSNHDEFKLESQNHVMLMLSRKDILQGISDFKLFQDGAKAG